ncbi:hypothetical protein GCM10027589_17140 [Actinocorallia lasiicapitis]
MFIDMFVNMLMNMLVERRTFKGVAGSRDSWCEDVEYAQAWLVRLGRELPPGSSLLGLVGLCLGLLARRYGALSEDGRNMVEELAERHRRDPADVDGRTADRLDDTRMFLV